MSYHNIGNIFRKCHHLKHSSQVFVLSVTRVATVAADINRYEDPKLANAKPFEQIPSIPTFPIIGSAWVYMPLIGRYSLQKQHIADRQKYAQYGDIIREKIGHLNIIQSYNPKTMEILFKNEGQYPTREEDGKEWWDLRSKTQKHIMKPKTIQAYLYPMQDVARDLVKRIYEQRDNNKEVPEFLQDLHKWALESIAFVGLDTRLGCLESNLLPESDGLRMINSVQTQFDLMNKLEAFAGNFQFWKYFPTPTWKKFIKAADVFTEIAFRYINRSLENLKKISVEDKELTLLQSMLLTKGLDTSGAMVTVTDMLMAGIDTTSHTVGFLLYHLAKNPDKQQILYEEIRKVLPNESDKITPTVFGELRYLKSCLKESMRLDPIVRGNARTLDHDVVISGYRVPAGTVIGVALQVVYRDEKYFKDPNQFIPERWIIKNEKNTTPFAFLPFGIGTRSCIGRRLAELEVICVSTEIIRNFKVEYHYEDIDMYTRLINTPDRPLKFTFIER
ncbi:LOW QUALITY PROTEIN: probable cytochrome P450 12a4, mitochondrial [Stegodyphus dumicola]|uniref:LOW QUALITY PROTEIN: probable cytochrome P450 12a4, mitochondrial n=1 Tax=Stegodyphus dumicola TaxID=202533 RepID=UPI0015ABA1C6|nr:LOW QUALITY PROTEIN: probable cytochrome P450 12a4, mitochondrial [Stegodyphus dumicola]